MGGFNSTVRLQGSSRFTPQRPGRAGVSFGSGGRGGEVPSTNPTRPGGLRAPSLGWRPGGPGDPRGGGGGRGGRGGRGGGGGGGGGGAPRISIQAQGWRPEELEAHRKRTEANLENIEANETEAARQFRADMTDADAASLEAMKEEAARLGIPFNVEEAMARLSRGRHRASAEQAVGAQRAYTNALVGATNAIAAPSGFEESSRRARHGEGATEAGLNLTQSQIETNRALAEQQMALQKLSTFINALGSMSVSF